MSDATQTKPKFQAQMPIIPGVVDRPTPEPPSGLSDSIKGRLAQAAILGATLVVVLGIGWWAYHKTRSLPAQAQGPQAELNAPPVEVPLPAPLVGASFLSNDPIPVGSLQEFSRPWSSNRFLFRKRNSSEMVPALAIRLPGGTGSEGSFWGFSLQAPYGRCELELVTDAARLAKQFGFKSRYPMVVDPCTGTVYDPLRMGTAPGGAWVRGEVVSGSGLRPPIAIEIRVRGNQVIATQIE